MDDVYAPISCMAHEKLEFAVLRRIRLRLRILEADGGERELRVLPTDVATRDQAEWLSYRLEDGAQGVVRLDRIRAADPL